MLRAALVALLAAAAGLAAAAAPAGAVTITCDPGQYLVFQGTPEVEHLRAHNLPRKTSGYAPRCLVAEAIASDVQRGIQDGDRPRTLSVHGARWGAGTWRCRYPEGRAECNRKGKPRRRVTMDLVG